VPTVCDDLNPCTSDLCDSSAGCAFVDNVLPCDDGDLCTTGDLCGGGTCNSSPVLCDDGNVCNGSETCDPGTGNCASAGPLVCDDGNACTDDTCNPLLGCVFSNNTDPCDDANLCTSGDTCGGGSCTGTALVCDDGNLCNGSESCDPGTGSCTSTGPLPCDDVNVCTDDTCNPLLGCVHTNNTASCTDGDTCTSGDVCAGGTCDGNIDLLCVLAALENLVAGADPAALGGAKAANKYLRQALRTRLRVENALIGNPATAQRNLNRARKTLGRINTRITKALNRNRIDPTLAAEMRALADQAIEGINALLVAP
jgi:hypothetical protein